METSILKKLRSDVKCIFSNLKTHDLISKEFSYDWNRLKKKCGGWTSARDALDWYSI